MKPIKLRNASFKAAPRPSEGEVINYKGWTLHYTIGSVLVAPAKVGDEVETSKGEKFVLQVGNPPQSINTSGRVHVRDEEGRDREFFPSVIGCKWVENEA